MLDVDIFMVWPTRRQTHVNPIHKPLARQTDTRDMMIYGHTVPAEPLLEKCLLLPQCCRLLSYGVFASSTSSSSSSLMSCRLSACETPSGHSVAVRTRRSAAGSCVYDAFAVKLEPRKAKKLATFLKLVSCAPLLKFLTRVKVLISWNLIKHKEF